MTLLYFCIFVLTPRYNLSFNTYGIANDPFIFTMYTAGLSSKSYNFNTAFISQRKRTYISDLNLNFRFDDIGYVSLGNKFISPKGLYAGGQSLWGIDFYSDRFSLGVFKRPDNQGFGKKTFKKNNFVLETSLNNSSYEMFLLTGKDYGNPEYFNLYMNSSFEHFNLYISPSYLNKFSLACKGDARFVIGKNTMFLSVKKVFKGYTNIGRKINPYLSLSGSINAVFFPFLHYSLTSGYTESFDRYGTNVSNTVTVSPANTGNFDAYYAVYSKNKLYGVNWSKSFGSLRLLYVLNNRERGYDINLSRKALSFTIHKRYSSSMGNYFALSTRVMLNRHIKGLMNYHYTENIQSLTSGMQFSKGNSHVYFSTTSYFGVYENSVLSVGFSQSGRLESPGLSTVNGVIFYDKDGNGLFNRGDKPMSNIKVVLDSRKVCTTNDNGQYSFKGVSKGEHYIYVDYGTLPADYGSVSEDYTKFRTGFITNRRIDMRIALLGSVSGKLYIDYDADGIFNDGDKPLAGCVVSLNNKKTWTDKDGRFVFYNVPPGAYTVKVVACPEHLTLISDNAYDIYVMPGDNIKGMDFSYVQAEEIKVKVKKF